MTIRVFKNETQAGKAAAAIFAAKIIANPSCVLGFATGSTPLPAYRALIEFTESGILDWSGVRSFNLDEYVGISRSHEQSYWRFMFDNLFSKVGIKPDNVRLPNPEECDAQGCADYDAAIEEAGGIDLQILGIGHNGHIAFNEPAEVFPAGTHVTELTESTIEANKRFFESADDVPKKAVTMGIGSIMKAKEIVIMASGKGKAEAVCAMVKGDVTPFCPASILQMHPAVAVLLDEEAASFL